MANRRNRFGRSVRNVRNRMAARSGHGTLNTGHSSGHGMTRRGFLRRAGVAAAGVAGAMVGGAGVAHALPPNSNIVATAYGYDVYPVGNPLRNKTHNAPFLFEGPVTEDIWNIQWAVNSISPGQTIKLMARPISSQVPKAFHFGTPLSGWFNGWGIFVTKSCTIEGEVDSSNNPLSTIEKGVLQFGVLPVFTPGGQVTIKNLVAKEPYWHFSGVPDPGFEVYLDYDNVRIADISIWDYAAAPGGPPDNALLGVWGHHFGRLTFTNGYYTSKNTSGASIDWEGGLVFEGFWPHGTELAFSNNEIHTNTDAASGNPYSHYGVYVGNTTSTNITVSYNQMTTLADNDAEIYLYNNFGNAISVFNNILYGTGAAGISINDSSGGQYSGNDLTSFIGINTQVYVGYGSNGNHFGPNSYPRNIYGSIAKTADSLGVFVVDGDGNIIDSDDFSACNVSGWTNGDLSCIVLNGNNNEVYEHPQLGVKYFPTGTSLCDQVENVSGNNYIHQWDKLCSGEHPAFDRIQAIQEKLIAHKEWLDQHKMGEPPYGEGWPPEWPEWPWPE